MDEHQSDAQTLAEDNKASTLASQPGSRRQRFVASLRKMPRGLVRGVQHLNATVLPPQRYKETLQLGLSVLEETYFVSKNFIDATISLSEKVLFDVDYHQRRIEEYRGQKRLLVFVPGYMQGPHGLYRLERYLGIELFDAFTYLWGDFPYSQEFQLSARQLATVVKDLHQQLNVEEIFLVGHSQGGLIIRTAVQRGLMHGLPVRKCLFLSSPHQGTWMGLAAIPHRGITKLLNRLPYAREVRGESGVQLVPGSGFLRELNALPLPDDIQFCSIYYNLDPMIWPPGNAVLPYTEANNYFINKVGHAQPLYCSRATELAIRVLYGKDNDQPDGGHARRQPGEKDADNRRGN